MDGKGDGSVNGGVGGWWEMEEGWGKGCGRRDGVGGRDGLEVEKEYKGTW